MTDMQGLGELVMLFIDGFAWVSPARHRPLYGAGMLRKGDWSLRTSSFLMWASFWPPALSATGSGNDSTDLPSGLSTGGSRLVHWPSIHSKQWFYSRPQPRGWARAVRRVKN
jgi:hypothetical protein